MLLLVLLLLLSEELLMYKLRICGVKCRNLYLNEFVSAGADSLTKAIEHTGQTYDRIGTLYAEQVFLLLLVLCEYSKFRIKSNSYFGIRFDLKQAQLFERAQLFESFEYLPSSISFLCNRMTPIFHLSNHV